MEIDDLDQEEHKIDVTIQKSHSFRSNEFDKYDELKKDELELINLS